MKEKILINSLKVWPSFFFNTKIILSININIIIKEFLMIISFYSKEKKKVGLNLCLNIIKNNQYLIMINHDIINTFS